MTFKIMLIKMIFSKLMVMIFLQLLNKIALYSDNLLEWILMNQILKIIIFKNNIEIYKVRSIIIKINHPKKEDEFTFIYNLK